MSSSVDLHLLYAVGNAPLATYPFPHLYVPEALPREFYDELLACLPEREAYAPISEVRAVSEIYGRTRFVMPLDAEHVGRLPDAARRPWETISRALLGGDFGNMLYYRFQPFLEQRFRNTGPVEFHHEAMLVRDMAGYSLGPHTDAQRKVVSVLFYLPRDASRAHLGTSIYVPKDRAFTCPGGKHHPYEPFERVRTMPYVPNSMFAFIKTPNAFHGVEPVEEGDRSRDLLLYDIFHRTAGAGAAPGASSGGSGARFTF